MMITSMKQIFIASQQSVKQLVSTPIPSTASVTAYHYPISICIQAAL